ncbi:hypothetical protein BU24DRAFT_495809 [Aaosphaeria arxii CBS 175.79]|uniref:Uncharacterized protein n=1 Tax=Aaosphaeria arxii CBS 175.79 TaxID=1450172 RepID=A0A6A5XFR7_9PLEO|nr:uncharacterized protein BU24DRAFT_495809 [Aaosphaeria arxii CBS 175.79]KAF2011671.1 hypothetical protein BU24DRAFT_495809 [Aaosphaeria arxii CBS 175.79]
MAIPIIVSAAAISASGLPADVLGGEVTDIMKDRCQPECEPGLLRCVRQIGFTGLCHTLWCTHRSRACGGCFSCKHKLTPPARVEAQVKAQTVPKILEGDNEGSSSNISAQSLEVEARAQDEEVDPDADQNYFNNCNKQWRKCTKAFAYDWNLCKERLCPAICKKDKIICGHFLAQPDALEG